MSFAFRHKRSVNLWPIVLLIGALGSGLLVGWLGPQVAQARTGLHLSNYKMSIGPGGAKAATVVSALVPTAAKSHLANTVDQPSTPADPQSVIGSATISAALIDIILAEYGSPAAGQGATFTALGAQYGIDPAFALAFYVQESHCGTRGVARFTHGIGNIRWTPGFASYEGYRAYPDYAAGIRDWFQLIRTLYVDGWGLETVATIVPRYAPAGDGNDPAAYTATVTALVATWRDRQSALSKGQ